MKYVIKTRQNYVSFIENVIEDKSFTYTVNVQTAKQFDSISEAINAIVNRSLANKAWISDFTIVGIKEVSTPRYEEVIL